MSDCMGVLSQSTFPAIPVLDDDGMVMGVLCEKDVLQTIINWAYDQRAGGTVRNYVSPLEVRVTPEMDLLTAARAFLACEFSCLPVMDDEVLVGRINRHDVLRGIDKWAAQINKERADRMSKKPEHERPRAIDELQRIAASHTREQLSQVFRKH
jgi:predicted transcriptional regulator